MLKILWQVDVWNFIIEEIESLKDFNYYKTGVDREELIKWNEKY